jgi:hypothetical protein
MTCEKVVKMASECYMLLTDDVRLEPHLGEDQWMVHQGFIAATTALCSSASGFCYSLVDDNGWLHLI